MASSRNVPLDELEVLLECPICMERVNDPRSLPCFHNFCKVCLENYVEGLRDGKNVETFPCTSNMSLRVSTQIKRKCRGNGGQLFHPEYAGSCDVGTRGKSMWFVCLAVQYLIHLLCIYECAEKTSPRTLTTVKVAADSASD